MRKIKNDKVNCFGKTIRFLKARDSEGWQQRWPGGAEGGRGENSGIGERKEESERGGRKKQNKEKLFRFNWI